MNLVTGATGIVGSHVVLRMIQSGRPVIAAKRQGSDLSKIRQLFHYHGAAHSFEKVEWREVDVTDVFSVEDALEGIERVYHCAGFVSFQKKDRKKLFQINETGTFNVVTACQHVGVKALCHVSSIATINNSDQGAELSEDVFWKRSGRESDYAISKYNAEREVWRGMEEGLNAVIVNPGVVLSAGFWDQSSSRLFSRCMKGNAFYTLGNAGYVSARDVAEIMIRLTENRHFANRYIVIEDNYTFREIFDLVSAGLQTSKPSFHAGKWLLQSGRFIDYLRSRIGGGEQDLTGAIIHSAYNAQKYQNAKVKKALNFNFISVKEEIRDICRILLEERRK